MAFVPVPNTVQVEAVYELDGQVIENVMYIESSAAWDAAGITAILDLVRTHIEEDLLPLLSVSIQLVRLIGTLLDAVDSIAVTLNVNPPVSGGIEQEQLPNNVCYCVTFLTAARGRSFRGRNYISGWGEQAVEGNNIAAASRTGLLSFYDALRADIVASGYQMVVVSRISGGAERTTGVTSNITGFTTFDTVMDSQRRRLPGRGR